MGHGTSFSPEFWKKDLASIPIAQRGVARLAIARLKSAGVPVASFLAFGTNAGAVRLGGRDQWRKSGLQFLEQRTLLHGGTFTHEPDLALAAPLSRMKSST